MVIVLILLCVGLYYTGGQKWAHTLFRDWGVPLCILGIMTSLFGWQWYYVFAFFIIWAGCSIGDDLLGDGRWYWSIHGLVIGLGTCVLGLWQGMCVAVGVAVLTYIVSRFLNKWGIDVICRGLIYGSMPLIFLIWR